MQCVCVCVCVGVCVYVCVCVEGSTGQDGLGILDLQTEDLV